MEFSRKEEYLRHVISHDSKLTSSQLNALSRINSRPAKPPFEKCPLGDDYREEPSLAPLRSKKAYMGEIPASQQLPLEIVLEADSDEPRRVLRHVERHLQCLATLSLDWFGDERVSQSEDLAHGSDANDEMFPDDWIDPDWEGELPQELELDVDPAWSTGQGLLEDHPHQIRQIEWALSKDDKVLPLHAEVRQDPMVLEFSYSFYRLHEKKRADLVVLPPEANHLPGDDDTARAKVIPTRMNDSDGGDDEVQRRLLKTSKRFNTILTSRTSEFLEDPSKSSQDAGVGQENRIERTYLSPSKIGRDIPKSGLIPR